MTSDSTRVDSLLDPIEDERLIADLPGIVKRTGVGKDFIEKPMWTWCDEEEIKWVTNLRITLDEGSKTGLRYVGGIDRVLDRMSAIGGACIRNYIEARIVPLEDLGEYDHADVSVLLVPDFYTGGLSRWKRSKVFSILMARHAAKQATVVYISNEESLKDEYGIAVWQHLNDTMNVLRGKL